ncbi:hypothetical protein K438DRAFT_1985710 [Mycena galopus ATCC 62051]|nr:hypothetical protein K438DRAFT_1985710 [Mycena galopus ATCC 62051]
MPIVMRASTISLLVFTASAPYSSTAETKRRQAPRSGNKRGGGDARAIPFTCEPTDLTGAALIGEESASNGGDITLGCSYSDNESCAYFFPVRASKLCQVLRDSIDEPERHPPRRPISLLSAATCRSRYKFQCDPNSKHNFNQQRQCGVISTATCRSRYKFQCDPNSKHNFNQPRQCGINFRDGALKCTLACKLDAAFFSNGIKLTDKHPDPKSSIHSCGPSVLEHLPAGLVAGIVLLVVLVLFGLIAGLIFRRQRVRKGAAHQYANKTVQPSTISPFELITQFESAGGCDFASRATEQTGAPHSLHTELREKRVNSPDLESSTVGETTVADSNSPSTAGRRFSLISRRSSTHTEARSVRRTVSTRTAAQPDMEAELQLSREQMAMLVARMNALEANTDTAWGIGGTDEPPPQYM